MIWRQGDRPVDQNTVEERIIYGLYLTGMSRMEARDWLKLHDTDQVKEAVNELYTNVWAQDEAFENEPKRHKLKVLHRSAVSLGARMVWNQALDIRNTYWSWWKTRYAEELEKPDVERH